MDFRGKGITEIRSDYLDPFYLPNAMGRPPWYLCIIKKLTDHSSRTQADPWNSCEGTSRMKASKRITATLSRLMK